MEKYAFEQEPKISVSKGHIGETGPTGAKGEPGPCGINDELKLIEHIISRLESDAHGVHIRMPDGQNHHISVDGYALQQAIDVLYNYRALLREPLHELISHCFFHTGHRCEEIYGLA